MRICLNMIVKNEAAVIARCLATVKPWVDHWVIVDTGSTDGTQELVRKTMEGVPGTLHERPWRDFAHNRNEALALAKNHGDYLLFIDADETLQMPAGWRWPQLSGEGYQFRSVYEGWDYLRSALIATRLPWRWEGVLHEFLTSDAKHTWQALPGPVIAINHDGARGRDPQTYLRDIEVLERAARNEPDNTRTVFYLAQSYRDAARAEAGAGNAAAAAARIEQAIATFRRRAGMGGWDEEAWFSRYQIAAIGDETGAPADYVREGYLAAYQLRPTRAEPLCELARFHRQRGEYALAHLYARQAAAIPYPQDTLLVNTAVYTWRALDELAVAAYYLGGAALTEGRAALEKLWAEGKFPAAERERISANRGFYGVDSAPAASSPTVTKARNAGGAPALMTGLAQTTVPVVPAAPAAPAAVSALSTLMPPRPGDRHPTAHKKALQC